MTLFKENEFHKFYSDVDDQGKFLLLTIENRESGNRMSFTQEDLNLINEVYEVHKKFS